VRNFKRIATLVVVSVVLALLTSTFSAAMAVYDNTSSQTSTQNTFLVTTANGNHPLKYYGEIQHGKVIKMWPAPEAYLVGSADTFGSLQSYCPSSMNNQFSGNLPTSLGMGMTPTIDSNSHSYDIAKSSAGGNTVTTASISTTSTNDIIVATEYCGSSGVTLDGVSSSSPTSFTWNVVPGSSISNPGSGVMKSWYAICSGKLSSETFTFSSTGNSGSTNLFGIIYSVSGGDTVSLFDPNSGAISGSYNLTALSGSGSTSASTTISTSYSDDLIVGFLGSNGDSGGSITYGSGYTGVNDYTKGSGGSAANEYKQSSSILTGSPVDFTINKHGWIVTAIAFTAPLSVYISGPSTLDQWQSVSLTANPSGGSGTYSSYQWYLGGTSPSDEIVGATSSTLDLSTYSDGSYTFYVSVYDSFANTATSSSFAVTISPPLSVSITSPTSPQTIGAGVSLSITGAFSGGLSPYSYKWVVQTTSTPSVPSSGYTTGTSPQTYSFSSATTGTYYVFIYVKDTNLMTQYAYATVAVVTPFMISPGSGSIDQGQSITAAYYGGASPTTQYWYASTSSTFSGPGSTTLCLGTISVSGSSIIHGDSIVLGSNITSGKTWYFAITTHNTPPTAGSTTSNVAPLYVYPPVLVSITTPTSPVAIDVSQTLEVIGSYSAGSGTYGYQWVVQTSNTPSIPGSGYASGTSPQTFTFSSGSIGTYYVFIYVMDSNGGTGYAYATVNVHADPTVSISTTGPYSYDVGQSASMLTADVTYSGPNTASVEWYVNTVDSCTGATDTGISGTTFTPSTPTSGTTYYFAVVSDSGVTGYTYDSNLVEVTVYETPTISILLTTGPYSYDVDQSATDLGASVTYFGTSTGYPSCFSGGEIYVEWYSASSRGLTYVSDSGSMTDTGISGLVFTPSTLSSGTTYYYAVVFDTNVPGFSDTSPSVEVNVYEDSTVSVLPTGPLSYDVDQSASTLTADVTYSGPNTASVEWYTNTIDSYVGATDTGVSGSTFTASTSSSGTMYYFAEVSDSGVPGYTYDSNTIEVTVNSALTEPTISITPGTVDDGNSATLSVDSFDGSGTPTYTAQWLISSDGLMYYAFGSPITGLDSSGLLSLTEPTGSLSYATSATWYFELIIWDSSDAGAEEVWSMPVTVIVNPPLIVSITGPATMDQGQSLSLAADVSGGSGGYTMYQWYLGGTDPSDEIAGQTTSSLDLSAYSSGTYTFYASVYDSFGTMAISADFTVIVSPPLSVSIIAPTTPQTIDLSQELGVVVSFSDGSGYYEYQWAVQTDSTASAPGSGYVTGTSPAMFLFDTASTGTYYVFLYVEDSNGGTGYAYATVSVSADPTVYITGPAIIDQDQSGLLSANPSAGLPPYLSYQWYLGGTDSSDEIVGATSSELDLSTYSQGTYTFYVAVTDSNLYTVLSAPFTLTVDPSLAVSITGPVTSDQGQLSYLTADPSGGSGTYTSYQWYIGGTTVGDQIAGETSSTLDLSTYLVGTYTLYVTVTDDNLNTVFSTSFDVTIDPALSVSITSSLTVSVDANQDMPITGVVSGGTGTGYEYAWVIVSHGDTPSNPGSFDTNTTTGDVTSVLSFPYGGTYDVYLFATDSNSNVVGSLDYVTVSVYSPLLVTITSPTATTTIDLGESLEISAAFDGGSNDFLYQWVLQTDPSASVPLAGYAAGTSPQTYTFTPVTIGTYYVFIYVKDTIGDVQFASLEVIVNQAFVVTIPITSTTGESTTVSLGGSVTISGTPTMTGGTPPYYYQWYLNGTTPGNAILGASGSAISGTPITYVFTPSGLGAYTFYLVITDSSDPVSFISNVVTVTVVPHTTPPTTTFYTVTFTETGLPAGATWYLNITNGPSSGPITSTTYYVVLASGSYGYSVSTSYTATVGNVTYAPISTIGTVVVNGSTGTQYVAFSPITFSVVFTETGLPSDTLWYLNLTNGQSFFSTTSTIALTEPNGTYYYELASIDGIYSGNVGTFVVNGTSIDVPVVFTMVTYSVVFTESGLPDNSLWYVDIASGQSYSSSAATIEIVEPNGTYQYQIRTDNNGYYASGGTFAVDGAAMEIQVTFTAVTYSVVFTESGLTSGVSWAVTLNGETLTSTGQTIEFIEGNGTYAYSIGSVSGFLLDQSSGSVVVSGSDLNINVAFEELFQVMITESGLPTGTSWYVNLTNGESFHSTTSVISFMEPNGTYHFTLYCADSRYAASPLSGQFTVGTPVSLTVNFVLIAFQSVFESTGLPAGTTWTVTVNGIVQSSATPSLMFYEANGTYQFSVSSIPGYAASVYSGNVTVDGKAAHNLIEWSIVSYQVSITAPDYPLTWGILWYATIHGTTFNGQHINTTVFSYSTNMTFALPNGTYSYELGLPAGAYGATSGSFEISGQSVNVNELAMNYLLLGVIIAAIVIIGAAVYISRRNNGT
jgi:hypothetical protein